LTPLLDDEKEKLIAKLYFYDEESLRMALNGPELSLAMIDLQQWLRNKVRYESGLEDKKGKELEHYVDAYCTVREELFDILRSYGLDDAL
jgi:hypothetical protein|tara:strand:- start:3654 stop:3923 length:270 start_codon:yes stop_codon:yes gene_type:complete